MAASTTKRQWAMGQRYVPGVGIELTIYEPKKGEIVKTVTGRDFEAALRLARPTLQHLESKR